MSDAGFVTLLAKGRVRCRAEPAELRQAICARLSGDARLGQNSPRPSSAEGSDRKNFREICRSISPSDEERNRQRLAFSLIAICFWTDAINPALVRIVKPRKYGDTTYLDRRLGESLSSSKHVTKGQQ